MVAGFVHGVLNTDNMNVTGESFDYGPWRWLPRWDPAFTAAYFDHSGLYAFGRQPEALHWNCGQLAVALRLLADAPPLIAALERFGPLYQQALARRFLWRLGLQSRGFEADSNLVEQAERALRSSGDTPDVFFHRHRFGRNAPTNDFGALLAGFDPAGEDHPLWAQAAPPAMQIEEVERIWSAIAGNDDWSALHAKVSEIRELGAALGQILPPC
jgi:serine/tyrosine/threonine adenylyltransferase